MFGAYLAGLTLTYVARPLELSGSSHQPTEGNVDSENNVTDRTSALSFEEAYRRMIGPLQNHILAPLFFASIGYAIVRQNISLSMEVSLTGCCAL